MDVRLRTLVDSNGSRRYAPESKVGMGWLMEFTVGFGALHCHDAMDITHVGCASVDCSRHPFIVTAAMESLIVMNRRMGGLTAVFSLIIWCILTPFMATIWVYGNGFMVWEQKPLLVRTAGQWLAVQGAFDFAEQEVVYFSYGRYFFLVYLLLIPTLMVFHKRLGCEDKWCQRWYKILLYALLLAGICDFVSYGLGVFAQLLWQVGFMLELLALMVIVVATLFYGRSLLKKPIIPRWPGWLLILAAILVLPMFFEQFLSAYWPNSPVLPLVLTWSVIGLYLGFSPQTVMENPVYEVD